MYGSDLLIARDASGKKIYLTEKQRGRHLYVVGSTGSGKSKFLEYLIRQDCDNWYAGDYSILLLDWTGAIYEGLMEWLAEQHPIVDRPVIPIDLSQDDWVVAYNFVRKRAAYDDAVSTELLLKQLTYIWGGSDTNATANIETVASTVFHSLISQGLTLDYALDILAPANKEFRLKLAIDVRDTGTGSRLLRLRRMFASQHAV
jgi:hypothetical protein